MSKKVAVILSGCGYLDGAEIRESVLSLLALDQAGATVDIYAPNEDQHHVVNHKNSEETKQSRNILDEAARIARGKLSSWEDLNSSDYDALVLPGGFGVAKNLSKLAFDGPDAVIHPTFDKILKDFYSASKPIGAICIAPAVICLSLGKHSPEVTIGCDQGTAEAIKKLGGKHIHCEAHEFHIDSTNKIVTTPAYMYDDGKISDISRGIHGCINAVIEMS